MPLSAPIDQTFPKLTMAVEPPIMDVRHLVQHAACTVHGTDTPLDALPDNNKWLMKFVIPAAAKETLRAVIVDGFRITDAYLFPDLENLAVAISDANYALPNDQAAENGD